MKQSVLVSVVAACAALMIASVLEAQPVLPDGTVDAQRLEAEGWVQVAPGVLQRERPGQPLETLAFGPDGLKRAVQEVRGRHALLLEAARLEPSAELEEAIEHLARQAQELEKTIDVLESEGSLAVHPGCDIAYGCNSNAYPLSGTQGVGANSSSYFVNNCGYVGTVYADSYGFTNGGTDFQSRNGSGTNLSRSASISVPGGPSCFSDAISYVDVPSLGIYFSCYQSNSSCPPPPPSVTLFGPSYISIFGYDCATEYWFASASGGTPPYGYSWSTSYGGGSGDTFSITFCGFGSFYTEWVDLSVTVTDSASQSASDWHSTQVQYYGACGQFVCEPF